MVHNVNENDKVTYVETETETEYVVKLTGSQLQQVTMALCASIHLSQQIATGETNTELKRAYCKIFEVYNTWNIQQMRDEERWFVENLPTE